MILASRSTADPGSEYEDTVTTRRVFSRKVAPSAAFLALAAGGTAACDASGDEDADAYEFTTYDGDTGGYGSDGR